MTTRPDVSPDAVVDFDHHSDDYNLNELAVNADLRRKCPVAWNENYGGFWFLTSYDAVSQAGRDGDTFAHKYEPNAPDGIDYQGEMGVPRPEGHPALGIGEIDGPYHQALRHALAPFLSPGAVQKSSHSWNTRHTTSSTNASATARWTSCSTTPARSRPSSP